MSCRQDFFRNQTQRALETWATKRTADVDVMYYNGGWEHTEIEGNHVKVCTPDGLDYTFLKTYMALSRVYDGYDWIMRVNTSTYVNIPLVEMFVNTIADKDTVYGTDLYSLTEACAPFPLSLYARGNGILIHHDSVKLLLKEGINMLYSKIVDDVAIGNTINSYYIKETGHCDAYLEHIGGLPHAWYNCVKNDNPNGHALSSYGCNKDMDYYNKFITVQTKMYFHRDNEEENALALWDMMKNAPEPSLDTVKEYMKDPSVFVGSVIGYIPLSLWKQFPKDVLYHFEMANKAVDDKENPNYSQELYNKLHAF